MRFSGIANRTLRRWIKEGKIKAVNIGGRWRIPESEVKRLLGQPIEKIRTPRAARAVIYARVSGANQKKELENQIEALKKYVEQNNWELVGIIKDIASGLKEGMRGLWKLIDMAEKHEFDVLLVAYKDRLTRFGFKYLEEFFKAYGVKVVVAFQEPPKDFYRELVEDLIKIFTSFVSRIYGKRSHKYKKVMKAVERQLKTLEKTVVLVSLPLTKIKAKVLGRIYQVYGRILIETLEYMWNNNITSWTRAKKVLYRKFRKKYGDIPSHYIHEAIRDASQRLKSFRKLRKRGLTKTNKPIVRKWSIGCDNQLWKLTLEGVRIATHKGWINAPLQFHKLFWRYCNDGWILRSSARWKLVGNNLYLYVVFTKEAESTKALNSSKLYGIDINENNVTIYTHPDGRAITIVTNFSKVALGYACRRAKIQRRWSKELGVKDNRRLRTALKKLRERNVKRDIKLKLVKAITNIVKDGIAVLEKLPKRFQDKVIERDRRFHGLDVHRLKQSSIRGLHKLITEKLTEHNIPYVLVDPFYTSSICPICSSKLVPMMGNAQRNGWKPRLMKCPKCGFIHDRDVIGAMNLVKKYLLDVGGYAVCLPKGAHDLHVEWLVATVKHGVEAQPVLVRPTMT